MTPSSDVQAKLRSYLLAQLDDDSWEQIEKDLLLHGDLFEELLVIEDEIIDEYLSGRLSETNRAGFEKHFLSTPERHEQLRFGRALNRYVMTAQAREKVPDRASPVLWSNQMFISRTAIAVTVIAAIAAGLWFLLHPKSSPETFATITLSMSAGSRGEAGVQASTVRLPLGADSLRIILRLPDTSPPAARYRVELENYREQKKSLETVAQESQSVTIVIPSSELKPGQYALKLFAIRRDGGEQRIAGSYFFTVE